MRFLITGGAGFIGSNLVDLLLDEGYEVRVFDDLSTGFKKNLNHVMDKIDFVEGSITDKPLCLKVMEGVDKVIHLAAQISVPKSLDDPAHTYDINVTGTENVFAAMVKHQVTDLVMASSCAIYGNPDQFPVHEQTPTSPLSPYAISKLTGEHICNMYQKGHGIKTSVFRFFNVFGPRQDPLSPYASVIPIFIHKILNGSAPKIFGDGEQTRDFVYVKDLVKILRSASLNFPAGDDCVWNVATGEQVSVNGLLDKLNNYCKQTIKAEFVPARQGEVRHSLGSLEKLQSTFGKLNQNLTMTPFDEALQETLTWFKEPSNLTK